MDQDAVGASGAAVDTPLECTFDEANARFYGEWVLFQILEFDEHWVPVRGLVWAHAPKHEDIFLVLATRPKRTKEDPYQPYYPFYASRARTGESRLRKPSHDSGDSAPRSCPRQGGDPREGDHL